MANELRVDTINDNAGSGPPDFPNGLTSLEATTSTKGIVFKAKWARHNLAVDDTFANLTFNSLTIGQMYRASLTAYATITANNAVYAIQHNSADIATISQRDQNASISGRTLHTSVIFKAAATTLTVAQTGGGAETVHALDAQGTSPGTYLELEELTAHSDTATTDWD